MIDFQHSTSKRKTGRTRNILLVILIVFVVAIGGGIWYWNTHKHKIIRDKIETAFTEKSGGLYKVAYQDLNLDELGGSMSINNMSIKYDSAKFDSLLLVNDAPSLLFNIQIPEISITGVKTPRALVDKEIVARRLVILNPVIEIYYTRAGKDSTRNTPTKAIYEQILGNLKLIKVDTVELRQASIVTRTLKGNKERATIKNLHVIFTDLAVDSVNSMDSTRFLFSKSARMNCEEIAWKNRKGLHHFSMKHVSFNSDDKLIGIGELSATPNLGEDAYVRQFSTQTERMGANFKDIKLKQVDFGLLMDEVVLAESLEVGSASVKIYCDLAIPRDNKNRSGTYPHQMITKVPIDFYFKNAVISTAFIEYRERHDITRQVGDLQFYNTVININNLTNIPSRLKDNNLCRIDINSRLLNIAPIKAVLQLPLGSKNGDFTIEGSAGEIDLTIFNQLAETTGMTKIKKGNAHKLEFKIKGNNTRADGNLLALYDNLRVNVLEVGKDSTLNKKTLTTFVANLQLNDENPDKNESPRRAEIHYDRNMNRSFFSLIWKSIFSGISQTIGNKRKPRRS